MLFPMSTYKFNPNTPAANRLANAVFRKIKDVWDSSIEDDSLAQYTVALAARGSDRKKLFNSLKTLLGDDATGVLVDWLLHELKRWRNDLVDTPAPDPAAPVPAAKQTTTSAKPGAAATNPAPVRGELPAPVDDVEALLNEGLEEEGAGDEQQGDDGTQVQGQADARNAPGESSSQAETSAGAAVSREDRRGSESGHRSGDAAPTRSRIRSAIQWVQPPADGPSTRDKRDEAHERRRQRFGGDGGENGDRREPSTRRADHDRDHDQDHDRDRDRGRGREAPRESLRRVSPPRHHHRSRSRSRSRSPGRGHDRGQPLSYRERMAARERDVRGPEARPWPPHEDDRGPGRWPGPPPGPGQRGPWGPPPHDHPHDVWRGDSPPGAHLRPRLRSAVSGSLDAVAPQADEGSNMAGVERASLRAVGAGRLLGRSLVRAIGGADAAPAQEPAAQPLPKPARGLSVFARLRGGARALDAPVRAPVGAGTELQEPVEVDPVHEDVEHEPAAVSPGARVSVLSRLVGKNLPPGLAGRLQRGKRGAPSTEEDGPTQLTARADTAAAKEASPQDVVAAQPAKAPRLQGPDTDPPAPRTQGIVAAAKAAATAGAAGAGGGPGLAGGKPPTAAGGAGTTQPPGSVPGAAAAAGPTTDLPSPGIISRLRAAAAGGPGEARPASRTRDGPQPGGVGEPVNGAPARQHTRPGVGTPAAASGMGAAGLRGPGAAPSSIGAPQAASAGAQVPVAAQPAPAAPRGLSAAAPSFKPAAATNATPATSTAPAAGTGPSPAELKAMKEKLKLLEMSVSRLKGELAVKQATDEATRAVVDADARSVVVRNLPPTTTEEVLRAHFSVCGAIVRLTLLRDPATQLPTGVAYIEYAIVEGRSKALTLSNTLMLGAVIRVFPKPPRNPMAAASVPVVTVPRAAPAGTAPLPLAGQAGPRGANVWRRPAGQPAAS